MITNLNRTPTGYLTHCPCGHRRPLGPGDGPFLGGARNPRHLRFCPGCGRRTWQVNLTAITPAASAALP
jgi:hypothetical protein